MLQKLNIIFYLIIFSLVLNPVFSADIPIIVIAPSKKAQSLSTVGTSVTIYNEADIGNSNDSFIGDILSDGPSMNFNQSGGKGTISGIQLRGLPKAYSTVYIDGVKMSDNSTPKNDYYIDDILSSQISRVEILRGNQSSMYGSGALGGTINITTKRGKPGLQKNYFYNTGTYGTQNASASISGADDDSDFYVGLEGYITDGISAMSHNEEKDSYKNYSLVANYGYKPSDNTELRTNYRFIDARLDYDSINRDYPDHLDNSHEKESAVSANFLYKPSQRFTNSFNFSNGYNSRTGNNIKGSFTNSFRKNNYWSYRTAINYQGIYNFNLDNSIVFGTEKEWNEMDYEENGGRSDATDVTMGEEVTSKYFDFQSRLSNNLYATAGIRFDDHTQAGDEDSERFTLAYLIPNGKLKASHGTGIKFPSLYEFKTSTNPSNLVAESGKSIDLGIEKSFPEKNLSFDITFFKHSYQDTIEGWQDASWTPVNMPGTVTSKGVEVASKYKLNDIFSFALNYTYNSTYDGADFDDPNMGPNSQGLFTNSQLVRIPRNLINLNTQISLLKDLDISLKTKWSDSTRDYNNINVGQSDGDKRLAPYLLNDLSVNYNIGLGYKAFMEIGNIWDKEYYTALEYNMMPRTANFGIKRSY